MLSAAGMTTGAAATAANQSTETLLYAKILLQESERLPGNSRKPPVQGLTSMPRMTVAGSLVCPLTMGPARRGCEPVPRATRS